MIAQYRVPILFSLAILDKNITIVTPNVFHTQTNHFPHPKSGPIYCMEYGPMFNIFRKFQNCYNFFFAEDIWKIYTLFRSCNRIIFPRHPQCMLIITFNGINRGVLFLFTDFIFYNQMINKAFYLLFRDRFIILLLEKTKKILQLLLIGSYGRYTETF